MLIWNKKYEIKIANIKTAIINNDGQLLVCACAEQLRKIPYTGKFLRRFIFMNFSNFAQSWNFICEILPCHAFYVAHVDHLQKYFSWNYWNCHICENLVMRKFLVTVAYWLWVLCFVAKINFAKMLPCHTFLLSMWLFAKIFFQLIWKSLAIITGHDNDQ